MINVKRLDCPDKLKVGSNPASMGETETLDAIEYYRDPKNHQEKYKRMGSRGSRIEKGYTTYSEKEVRKALLEMFNGKCAYCESKITAIYNGDIEHFRPKGKINEAKLKFPGYFWLASEWENLLFACPFCNQTNTHEFKDGSNIGEAVFGKLDQFPLLTERYRLNYNHGLIYFADNGTYTKAFNLEESERLLLNPCKDENIEKYFKYNDDGAIVVNDRLSSFEKKKSNQSILTYALHRLSLSNAREEKIIQIKAQIRRVEIAIKNYDDHLDSSYEKKTWFDGIMREEMQILKRFKDADQEYAALARYIIDKYFDEAKFV
jgi:sarcosine oxidase delta subunit